MRPTALPLLVGPLFAQAPHERLDSGFRGEAEDLVHRAGSAFQILRGSAPWPHSRFQQTFPATEQAPGCAPRALGKPLRHEGAPVALRDIQNTFGRL